MQNIIEYRKFISITVSIAIFLLSLPISPAQAVMVGTESVLHPDSERISDRDRVRAFIKRTDVMAQMQVFGISRAEALSRIDNLTDREIASLAGRIDQISEPAGGNYELDGSLLAVIGLTIYAIFMAIAIYFSRTMGTEEKPDE